MSYVGSKDFLIEVQKGNVPGHSLVHKFGRNDGVPNGTWEMVSLLSVPTNFLAAATTVRIKAGGDVADTAVGAGAQEITVQGIAADLTEVSETITTAGVSASASTSTSFWRVYRAWVSSAGTYGGANTAAVTIENTAGTQDVMVIGVGEGQSQLAAYSIPTGKTGYLMSAIISVDAGKAADIRMCTRENLNNTTPPVSSVRIRLYWDGVLGVFPFTPRSPGMAFSALTDLWFEAEGSGAVTEVSADFELLLVDD